jgi:hypothetical protein
MLESRTGAPSTPVELGASSPASVATLASSPDVPASVVAVLPWLAAELQPTAAAAVTARLRRRDESRGAASTPP